MKQLLALSALVLATAAQAAPGEWPWSPASIYSLTMAMNCESWSLANLGESVRLNGALPGWLIFNECPGAVTIRGGGATTRAIPPFDGRLITFPGEQGVAYRLGLSGAGGTVVHICRI